MSKCVVGELINLQEDQPLTSASNNKPNEVKAEDETALSGFLTKISHIGPIKSSKQRWFEYQGTNCELAYYRAPNDPSSLLGKIPLSKASFNYAADDLGENIFTITIKDVTHTLKSHDDKSLLWWLQELQKKRRSYNSQLMVKQSELYLGGSTFYINSKEMFKKQKGLLSCDVLSSQSSNYSDDSEATRSDLVSSDDVPSAIGGKSSWKLKQNKKLTFNLSNAGSNFGEAIKGIKQGLSKTAPGIRNMLGENDQINELKMMILERDEELSMLKERLSAKEQSMELLKRELKKVESLSAESSYQSQCDSELLQLRMMNDSLEKKLEESRKLAETATGLKETVSLLQTIILAKDQDVMRLTHELNDSKQGLLPATLIPSTDEYSSNRETLHHLQDKVEGYILQNRFLNDEILEITDMRILDENRISQLESQVDLKEANFLRLQSKYLVLLTNLNKIRADNSGFASQRSDASLATNEQERSEIIKSLLQEVMQKTDQVNLKGHTVDDVTYDAFGFEHGPDNDAEATLLAAAGQMRHRSLELEKDLINYKRSLLEKWDNYFKLYKDLQPNTELKNLIRAGIPYQLRSQVWSWIVKRLTTKIQEKLNIDGDYYEELLKEPQAQLVSKQIELDLLRTLPTNRHFSSATADGIDPLRRVLRAYSNHNPAIGYCQGLNRLAAVSLLFLSEEDSFWCLVAIVECLMPSDYYSTTLVASQTDQRVFRDLLAEKLPRLHRHFLNHTIDTSLITFNWYLCIFCDNVPPDTIFHIWDIFLYEGSKVLFRFALAFFKIEEENILALNEYLKIFHFLKTITYKMVDSRSITNIAFNSMNPFPMRKIEKLRDFHRAKVEAEVSALESVRREFTLRSESIKGPQRSDEE